MTNVMSIERGLLLTNGFMALDYVTESTVLSSKGLKNDEIVEILP